MPVSMLIVNIVYLAFPLGRPSDRPPRADPCHELALILRQLADHLDEMPGTVEDKRAIVDSNGHSVGTMTLEGSGS